MKTTHAARLGAALAAALAAAVPAHAQIPLNARGLGMGNAHLATTRGQEALFQNPANLALPGNPHWSIALPQALAGATVLGLGLGDLNDLRDYNDLSDEQAQEILASIPAGTGVQYDVKLPLVSFQTGRFALGVSYNSVGHHSIDRDIVDLFLNDYQRGRVYSAGNTFGERSTYVDVAAAYAHRVGPVALGATAHYYHGRDLVRSGIADVDTLVLPSPDIQVTYAGVRSDAGRGFGLDLGAAIQPLPNLTLSAAVANVVSSLDWDEDLLARSLTLNSNEIQNADFRLLRTQFRDSERGFDDYLAQPGLDAEQRAVVSNLAEALTDRAEPPTTLRLGAAYSLPTGTDLAAAYHDELSDSRLGGQLWSRTLSLGVQQRVGGLLSLRAGIATNTDEASLMTAGLSLGPLQLGVGRLDNGAGAGGADREGWVASFGISTRSASVMP